MIKESIAALVEGRSLTFEMAAGAMEEIMGGEATPAQVGAFLTALRMKGETADEIAGFSIVMRAHATPVKITGPAIDVVGTGGDSSGTFNISTAAAFVVAGAGLKVAKHGNRAATSKCGAADVLEALGVKIDLTAAQVAACIEAAGIGFMFAPAFHPAMKYAAPVRKELGIRTVFNILGPLTNPAGVEHMLLGVASEAIGEKMAAVLHRLGIKHALVVHGGGLDEISISGKSIIWEIDGGKILPAREVSPRSFGLAEGPASTMAGGTPAENAGILRGVLEGEKGPRRDVAVINAAAALVAGDMTEDFKEAANLAAASIDSGRARRKLDALIAASRGEK
jgi:anthranilate phosphoribosyltransferase